MNNDCSDIDPDSDAAVLHTDDCSSLSDMVVSLQRHLALFMLKLREKHCLARNVRNSAVDDLKCVCSVITTTLCDTVRKQLQEAGISADNNEQLQQVLNVEYSISGAFDISSEYKLTKFCKENLGMIEAKEHVLQPPNAKLSVNVSLTRKPSCR